MKTKLIVLILLLGNLSCSTRNNNDNKSNLDRLFYKDNDFTFFELYPTDSTMGNNYKIREISYSFEFLSLPVEKEARNYISKRIINTESNTSFEGQNRIIQIELLPIDKPTKSALTIKQKCDDIILEYNYYKTVKWGCCGDENEYEIYDYNNELIIQGNEQIIHAIIPNSERNFYFSFKPEYTDTTILGNLYFSYGSKDNYQLKIKSRPLPEEYCSSFSPQIFLKTNDKRDRYNNSINEYLIWSLDNIKNKQDINGITLQVVFDCDPELKLDTISIPIIKGMPFGKDEKIQVINYLQN